MTPGEKGECGGGCIARGGQGGVGGAVATSELGETRCRNSSFISAVTGLQTRHPVNAPD